MAVDLRKVKKLIELVEESGIAELEVSSGDESVRIARYAAPASGLMTNPVMAAPASAVPASVDPASINNGAESAAGLTVVHAPMAGTFYRAADPQAAPFVDMNQEIAAGDVLCIIESMKMMHEIRAVEGGRVSEICVDNAQPISTGEVLFRLS